MTVSPAEQMRAASRTLQDLEDRLRTGGGAKKIEKQHRDGKMTARERVGHLIDPGSLFFEIGLLVAYDRYDGQAPAAVSRNGHRTRRKKTGRNRRERCDREGRRMVAGNNSQDSAGAGNRDAKSSADYVSWLTPAGVNLPYRDGIFPGQYGAARIFYYNSLMRKRLKDSADCCGYGYVHRRRRLFTRLVGRNHHGRGHQFHGPWWTKFGEGCGGSNSRCRIVGRCLPAH